MSVYDNRQNHLAVYSSLFYNNARISLAEIYSMLLPGMIISEEQRVHFRLMKSTEITYRFDEAREMHSSKEFPEIECKKCAGKKSFI